MKTASATKRLPMPTVHRTCLLVGSLLLIVYYVGL
jgi:hypothetical protein